MKSVKLENMFRGWFVGNFEPSVFKTNAVEVGVKRYRSGDHESWHFHKVATEITVVVSGRVKLNGEVFIAGDIIVIDPGEGADFYVLEDAVTTVVKLPGAINDKYFKEF